jgi:hypothetical protein
MYLPRIEPIVPSAVVMSEQPLQVPAVVAIRGVEVTLEVAVVAIKEVREVEMKARVVVKTCPRMTKMVAVILPQSQTKSRPLWPNWLPRRCTIITGTKSNSYMKRTKWTP